MKPIIFVSPAGVEEYAFLFQHETHISPAQLQKCLDDGRVLVARVDGQPAGWLRWSLFWDSVPFMSMLYVLEPFRGLGAGTALTHAWEADMKKTMYPFVLTSTSQDEYAQHFYVRLGYRAVGGFTPPGDPLELILAKEL